MSAEASTEGGGVGAGVAGDLTEVPGLAIAGARGESAQAPSAASAAAFPSATSESRPDMIRRPAAPKIAA